MDVNALYDFDRKEGMIVKYPIKIVSIVHIEKLKMFYAGIMAGFKHLKTELDSLPVVRNGLGYNPEFYNRVLNEMRKNAIVGLFHLWLRELQHFLAIGGDVINKNKNVFLNKGHEFILGLFANERELAPIIYILEKYGCLTNVIKHGLGNSFEKLSDEFLYEPDEYKESIVIDGEAYDSSVAEAPFVLQSHIDELYNATIQFWEKVPETFVVDCDILLKKNVR
jgi:hypothetical protein